jgi:hypothetical protein
MDSFITNIQVEELYDEQHQQDLYEYYKWLNEQNEQEPNQD